MFFGYCRSHSIICLRCDLYLLAYYYFLALVSDAGIGILPNKAYYADEWSTLKFRFLISATAFFSFR